MGQIQKLVAFLNNRTLGEQFVIAFVFAVLATALSAGLTMMVAPLLATPLEYFAVFTSYMCVVLCITQTRFNYPIGIISTFAYSIFFFNIGLYAMAAFNLYLVGSLIFGWFRWGKDAEGRKITKMLGKFTKPQEGITLTLNAWAFGYIGIAIAIYVGLMLCNIALGGVMTNLEIWATVLSGVAQFLLDNKRLETWGIWIIVNVLSLFLYFGTGAMLVGFQYVFFLGTAVIGFMTWYDTFKRNQVPVGVTNE